MTKPSLRDRLAAKKRPSIVFPVQVEAPGPAYEEAQQALLAAGRLRLGAELLEQQNPDEAATAQLAAATTAEDEARTALAAEVASRHVDVEFRALEPLAMERLTAAHTAADGTTDEVGCCPALAAACAVDEDLRDVAWWTGQLYGRPAAGDELEPVEATWALGEVNRLWAALLMLNTPSATAAVRAGKG